MKSFTLLTALLLSGSSSTNAALSKVSNLGPPIPLPPPLVDPDFEANAQITKRDATAVPTTGTGVFQQLIDHNDPSKGTFNQSYWWSSEFWSGPGAPVVFFTPGESAAAAYTGYLKNTTITGLFAEAIGGAVVLLEHRYWGDSSPYDVLTTENLKYLTLEQSIKDTTYFAREVRFPFDLNGTSAAPGAPWVAAGGSYSGALTAWTEAVDPGTYWAYYATSAVVETVFDFYQYFKPVEAGMPTNCSADVISVIEYVDSVLLSNDTAAKNELKAKFGLEGLEHDDDFASVLENGPWQWQGNSFTTGYSSFYQWCDAVENVGALFPNTSSVPGAEGVGLTKALDGYAKWIREEVVPGSCASYGYDDWTDDSDLGCFDSYNKTSPIYTDLTVDNPVNRQWMFFLCNEPFAFWQDGAPTTTTTLVSRLVTPQYWQRQCADYFGPPGTFGSAEGKTVEDVNVYTGGWDIAGNTTRLIYTNGQFDPWKDATVSSDYRPEGPYEGTADAPLLMVPDGIHCSDMIARNGAANAGVQKVIDTEVAQIKAWVDEFYVEKKKKRAVRRQW